LYTNSTHLPYGKKDNTLRLFFSRLPRFGRRGPWAALLADWASALTKFVKVFPHTRRGPRQRAPWQSFELMCVPLCRHMLTCIGRNPEKTSFSPCKRNYVLSFYPFSAHPFNFVLGCFWIRGRTMRVSPERPRPSLSVPPPRRCGYKFETMEIFHAKKIRRSNKVYAVCMLVGCCFIFFLVDQF